MDVEGPMSELSLQDQTIDVPILIVGGSVVGLTLAALLDHHGIKGCLVVDPGQSTTINPFASVLSPRTMQIFKELGLYEAILKESANFPGEGATLDVFESLSGRRVEQVALENNKGDTSALRRVFITSQVLERILRTRCDGLDMKVSYNSRIESFTQDSSGVTATILNTSTGTTSTIKANYMVSCHSSYPPTSIHSSIPLRKLGQHSGAFEIRFNVSNGEGFAQLPNAKLNGVTYIANSEVQGFFSLNGGSQELFFVGRRTKPAAAEVDNDIAAKCLRAAIGTDHEAHNIHQVTIIDFYIIEGLRENRVFFTGDAAHRLPPISPGSVGDNLGISEAHNLAWKLASVIKGQTGESLLETYQEERLPIAQLTVANEAAQFAGNTDPSLNHLVEKYGLNELSTERLEMGYRYSSGALFNSNNGGYTEDPTNAIAGSGSIAHHVLVSTLDGNAKDVPISTFFGDSFVLFIGPGGEDWEISFKRLQKLNECLRPIKLIPLQFDKSSAFARRYNVEEGGMVLVRPDGIVAESVSEVPWGPFLESVQASMLKKAFCLEDLERASSGAPPAIGAVLRQFRQN